MGWQYTGSVNTRVGQIGVLVSLQPQWPLRAGLEWGLAPVYRTGLNPELTGSGKFCPAGSTPAQPTRWLWCKW